MSNWEKQNINLGKVRVGVRQKIIFQKLAKEPVIVDLKASCGCSKPNYVKSKNQVIVLYKPQEIPIHLKVQGTYSTTKTVTVTYEDGSKEVLTFKGTIIQ